MRLHFLRFMVTLLFSWVFLSRLDAEILSIHVEVPGTLTELLAATGMKSSEIKELKLSGNIQPERDLKDWQAVFACTELEYLDISDLAVTVLPYETGVGNRWAGYSFAKSNNKLCKLKTIYLPPAP